jgi:hypothetical protein
MRFLISMILIMGLLALSKPSDAAMSMAVQSKDDRIAACVTAHNAAVNQCNSMASSDQAAATADMDTSATLANSDGDHGAFQAQSAALGQVSGTYAQKAGVCKSGFVDCQTKCNPAAGLSPNVDTAISDCAPNGPLDVRYQTLMTSASGNAVQAYQTAGVARTLASDVGDSNVVQVKASASSAPCWQVVNSQTGKVQMSSGNGTQALTRDMAMDKVMQDGGDSSLLTAMPCTP